jgi:hypothetical protein
VSVTLLGGTCIGNGEGGGWQSVFVLGILFFVLFYMDKVRRLGDSLVVGLKVLPNLLTGEGTIGALLIPLLNLQSCKRTISQSVTKPHARKTTQVR